MKLRLAGTPAFGSRKDGICMHHHEPHASHIAASIPPNGDVSSTPVERDLLRIAIDATRDGAACDAALAELREFRATDEGVSALMRHAQQHPDNAGCAAFAVAARMMYNAQLKAYLDQELETETRDVIDRFAGTPEASMLEHALSALSSFATEEELTDAREFFGGFAKDARAAEKFPHFRLLQVVAAQRLMEARSRREIRDELRPLRDEVDELAKGRQRSIVLRRLRARLEM